MVLKKETEWTLGISLSWFTQPLGKVFFNGARRFIEVIFLFVSLLTLGIIYLQYEFIYVPGTSLGTFSVPPLVTPNFYYYFVPFVISLLAVLALILISVRYIEEPQKLVALGTLAFVVGILAYIFFDVFPPFYLTLSSFGGISIIFLGVTIHQKEKIPPEEKSWTFSYQK